MIAEVSDVICESQIAVQDLSKPIVIECSRFFPSRSASRIRSKIRIFASIARPIERITPAIEARVRTTPVIFTRATNIKVYVIRATPVSYTHLDVYKRQLYGICLPCLSHGLMEQTIRKRKILHPHFLILCQIMVIFKKIDELSLMILFEKYTREQ